MFRSFLTVASSYVLTQILFFGSAYFLGSLFFPQFMDFFHLDEAAQLKMMAENPQAAIPIPMFWWMVVLNSIACVAVGWLAAKTAPFGKFQHGIFLAVLLFVMFLQVVVADPLAKKWMDLVYLAVLPVSVLVGAKRGSGGFIVKEDV